jgi:hypothetical protein
MLTILKGRNVPIKFVHEDGLPLGLFAVASETEVVYYANGQFVVVPMETVNRLGKLLSAPEMYGMIQEMLSGHKDTATAGDRPAQGVAAAKGGS